MNQKGFYISLDDCSKLIGNALNDYRENLHIGNSQQVATGPVEILDRMPVDENDKLTINREESVMSETAGSSLNATEIAVGSLLAGGRGGYGGYGGYGGGAWGGGYGGGGHAVWAGPGQNAVRINRNAQEIENQADHTRELILASNNGIQGAFENATRDRQFTDVKDGQFQAELRLSDRMRDLERDQNKCCCETQLGFKDVALEQQKCCCDSQLRMSEMEARIMARMEALDKSALTRENDQLRSRITQLEIFRECGCGCAGGVNPCP